MIQRARADDVGGLRLLKLHGSVAMAWSSVRRFKAGRFEVAGDLGFEPSERMEFEFHGPIPWI
jgi:hypothetical protein